MPKKPIIPVSRWYWVALLLLLICASLSFLTGYNFSLPYIDHTDEPAFNLAAQMILDSGSAQSMSFHSYPPGIIYTNFLALKLFHDGTGLPSEVMPQVRIITALFAILTILPLVALAYQVWDEFGSLLAGFLWICTPYVLESLRFATPNAYLTFFALSALALVYYAFAYNKNGLATLGIFSIMLAIVFKTQAIFVMPLVLGLPLLRLYTYPADKQAIIRNFILNSLRMGAFLFWLLVFYPTLRANEIPYWVAPTTSIALPSTTILTRNFSFVYREMIYAPLSVLVMLPYLLLFIQQIRQRMNLRAVLFVLLASGIWLFGVSLFGLQDARQSHTLIALLVILHSGSFVLLVFALQALMRWLQQRNNRLGVIRPTIAYAVIGIIITIGLLPVIRRNIQHIIRLTQPDSRVTFAQYIDSSLPPASFITTYENHKTLNPFWGGIPLVHEFQMFKQADLDEEPLQYWRDVGVEYAIVPYISWMDDARYGEYREQVTVLKVVEPSDLTRGPSMVLLYLNPIQHELEQELGGIRYFGYDISAETIIPGETIAFRLYWQAQTPTDRPYHVFNHLIGEDVTQIIAQVDAAPLFDERRSTDVWDDANEILLSRIFTLTIPPQTPAGEYTLISGFYEPQTFLRLRSAEGDYVPVTTITVRAAE